jgi:hypothetical protein
LRRCYPIASIARFKQNLAFQRSRRPRSSIEEPLSGKADPANHGDCGKCPVSWLLALLRNSSVGVAQSLSGQDRGTGGGDGVARAACHPKKEGRVRLLLTFPGSVKKRVSLRAWHRRRSLCSTSQNGLRKLQSRAPISMCGQGPARPFPQRRAALLFPTESADGRSRRQVQASSHREYHVPKSYNQNRSSRRRSENTHLSAGRDTRDGHRQCAPFGLRGRDHAGEGEGRSVDLAAGKQLFAILDATSAAQALRNSDKPFYVYVLLRPDGEPFYVGKGLASASSVTRQKPAIRPFEHINSTLSVRSIGMAASSAMRQRFPLTTRHTTFPDWSVVPTHSGIGNYGISRPLAEP